MTRTKFNSFKKKGNANLYSLEKGEPIFGESVFLINPMVTHRKSPAFSLLSQSKIAIGFFSLEGGGFIASYKGNGLLIFLSENRFDLFSIDSSEQELKIKLGTCEFVGELYKARTRIETLV